jgi:tetratricopeptide (TPR) repeat protein
MGKVRYTQDNLIEAISNCNDALEINPKIKEYYLLRGRVFCKMKFYEEAITDFKSALSLDVNYFPAHMGLAKLYEQRNDYSKSLDYYSKAVKIINLDEKATAGVARMKAKSNPAPLSWSVLPFSVFSKPKPIKCFPTIEPKKRHP